MFGVETVFPTLGHFFIACLILVIAEAVYVMLGFGAGLIAVGTLALLLPELRDVVVLLLLVSLPAELYVVRTSWRDISWRGVLLLFAGIGVGIPIGSWLLRSGDPSFLLVLLGGFLVVVGTVFLFTGNSRNRVWPTWVAPPVGLFSGILTGLFGTGGPPLVLYYQLQGTAKSAFRGNLMAIFLLMTTVRVPSYAVLGLITLPRLWSALALLPAVGLGAWIGNRIHLNLEESTFKRLVSAFLAVIGVVLLLSKG